MMNRKLLLAVLLVLAMLLCCGTAFAGTLTIPAGTQVIEEEAFMGCTQFTGDVYIPDSVTAIGAHAFDGCTGIERVYLPSGDISIDDTAFANTGIVLVRQSGQWYYAVNEDGTAAIAGVTASNVPLNIPHTLEGMTVTSILSGAFSGRTDLGEYLSLPETLTTIGASAFSGCTGLSGMLYIPDSVTDMGASAFEGCTGLTALHLSEGLTEIANNAFADCSGLMGELSLPESVTRIGMCAFKNCSGLTGELSLSDNVTEIGASAFYGCSGFTSLWLSANLTDIPGYAFAFCTGITGKVILHEKTALVGIYAFRECTGLNGCVVSMRCPDISLAGVSPFAGCTPVQEFSDGLLFYTVLNTQEVAVSDIWLSGTKPEEIMIPEYWNGKKVVGIADRAFAVKNLSSTVTLPAGLQWVGDSAFVGNNGLKMSGAFPAGLTEIGTAAFAGVVFTSELVIPEGFTYIPETCFEGATAPSLVIPEGVIWIDDWAFNSFHCSTTLNLPSTVQEIGSNAFSYSGFSGALYLPDALMTIDSYAFYDCEYLTSVHQGEGTIHLIGSSAFQSCGALASVTLDNVHEISKKAFCNCQALTSFDIWWSNLDRLGSQVFSYCTKLVCTVDLSNNPMISVAPDAFDNANITVTWPVTELFTYTTNAYGEITITGFILDELPYPSEITIPGTINGVVVTEIAEGAFANRTDIAGTLRIPDTVHTIFANAFYGCTSIREVIFDGSAPETIGDYAFYGCTGLTGRVSVWGTQWLGHHAFYGCSGIEELSLGAMEYIAESAFEGCSGIDQPISIGSDTKIIGTRAFAGCMGIPAVTFGEGLETIGTEAFKGCSGLTGELSFPASVIDVCPGAFSGCSGFTSLKLSDTIATIKNNVYENCTGLTGNLTIPACVTTIQGNAFAGCTGLSRITMHSYGVAVADSAFSGVTAEMNLTSYDYTVDEYGNATITGYHGDPAADLSIPDVIDGQLVTAIGEGAFFQRNDLTGTLCSAGRFVTDIGADAFYGCTNLKTSHLFPTWMGDSVRRIGDGAFWDCHKFAYIRLGDNVETIGDLAFYRCGMDVEPQLTSHRFPATLRVIGVEAFHESGLAGNLIFLSDDVELKEGSLCDCAITSITLPSKLTKIGQSVFWHCDQLEEIPTFPETLTYIGPGAFMGCTSAAGTAKIPHSVTFIGDQAFDGVPATIEIESVFSYSVANEQATITGYIGTEPFVWMPETLGGYPVVAIAANAFNGSAMPSGGVVLPASVTHVGANAFANCANLTALYYNEAAYIDLTAAAGTSAELLPYEDRYVYVPNDEDTVTIVGYFGGEVENNTIPSTLAGKTVTAIGDGAFVRHTEMTGTLRLPSTVTSIGMDAFAGCTGLSGIVLPEGLVNIGVNAFGGCTGLTGALLIPESVRNIFSNAFANCTGVTAVYLPVSAVVDADAFAGTSAPQAYHHDGFVYSLGSPTTVIINGYLAGGTNNLVIPNTIEGRVVTTIGAYAFQNRTDLTGTVTFPNQMTGVAEYAFAGCTNLTGTLSFPDTLVEVGAFAFYNTGFTGDLTFPARTRALYEGAFCHSRGLNGSLDLGNITYLGPGAFASCGLTGELVLPATLTSTGTGVFEYNNFSGLDLTVCPMTEYNQYLFREAITTACAFPQIPGCVTTIHDYAFADNAFTGTVVIPMSCATVYDNAFSGTDITVVQDASFSYTVTESGTVTITGYTGEDLTRGLNIPAVVEGRTVTAIADSAFQNRSDITGPLVIPDCVTSIGVHAFNGCSGLTGQLKLPASLVTMSPYCFSGCSGLTGGISIPDGVTLVDEGVFYGCTSLNGTLNLNKVQVAGNLAFSHCGLTGTLHIPSTMTYSGAWSFEYNNFSEIILTDASWTEYTDGVFFKAVSKECTFPAIPEGITRIGPNAFAECGFTGTALIPVSCTDVDAIAFYNTNVTVMLGSSYTYQVEADNTVTITGYNGAILNAGLRIPATIGGLPVRAIAQNAFNGRSDITGPLVLPEGLVTIGQGAFSECTGLTGNLALPSTVTTVYDYAFSGCTSLNGTLSLNKVSYVGCCAFSHCGLTGVLYIPSTLQNAMGWCFEYNNFSGLILSDAPWTSYSDGLFYDAVNTSCAFPTIPDRITSISPNAFAECSFTGTANIPLNCTVDALAFYNTPVTVWYASPFTYEITGSNTVTITGYAGSVLNQGLNIPAYINGYPVTKIADNAFKGRSDISGGLVLPSTLKTIGGSAFYNCKNLNGALTIPGSVTSIGAYCFYNCWTFNGTLVLPDSLTSISNYAFAGCTNMRGLQLPAKLKTIGSYAFKNNAYMTGTLTIPSTVSSIGAGAFQSCSGFTGSLVLPESLTKIGANAFNGCSGLTGSVIVGSGVTVGDGAFTGTSISVSTGSSGSVASGADFTYTVTDGEITLTGYTGSITHNLTIPDYIGGLPVVTLGERLFYNRTDLTGVVTLPGTLKTVGEYAFYKAANIADVIISEGVTHIEDRAFAYCTGLKNAQLLPSTLTWLDDYAFAHSGLSGQLYIPPLLKHINTGTFDGCAGLTGNLVWPDGLTHIYTWAFRNCTGIRGFVWAEDHKIRCEGSTFDGCTSLYASLTTDQMAGVGDMTSISSMTYPLRGTHVTLKNSWGQVYDNENGGWK